jgi:plasmid stability protein
VPGFFFAGTSDIIGGHIKGYRMVSIIIHNLPEATYRALRARAKTAGRSTEAEILAILEQAIYPEGRVKLGSLLAQIGREAGGVDLEIERDKTPPEPTDFG